MNKEKKRTIKYNNKYNRYNIKYNKEYKNKCKKR